MDDAIARLSNKSNDRRTVKRDTGHNNQRQRMAGGVWVLPLTANKQEEDTADSDTVQVTKANSCKILTVWMVKCTF